MKIRLWQVLLVLCAIAASSLAQATERFILVQSTTSTQNSGLFDHILPLFEAETGIEVRVVAVGTGQAIRNAQNGDGDVLLVHSRAAEEDFVAAGHGIKRHNVMYNDFVIVGPAGDPAGVGRMKTASEAFDLLSKSGEIFVSRGDDSGTHKTELRVWATLGTDVSAASGSWYRETGSGMGATLNVAVGMDGYTLADRATWISFGNKSSHQILFEGDPALFNQYGIIRVNPQRHPNVKAKEAELFETWLLSEAGQSAIAGFVVEGQQMFTPNADPVFEIHPQLRSSRGQNQ